MLRLSNNQGDFGPPTPMTAYCIPIDTSRCAGQRDIDQNGVKCMLVARCRTCQRMKAHNLLFSIHAEMSDGDERGFISMTVILPVRYLPDPHNAEEYVALCYQGSQWQEADPNAWSL